MIRVEAKPSKGTAQILLWHIQQLANVLLGEGNISSLTQPASMEEGVKVKGGASENYKRMGRFASYIYYHLIGDEANYQKFRTQTLNFIRDERKRGHIGGEQGCNQPHDGLHLSAVFLVHLFATQQNDIELLQETGWWIGAYLAICKACFHASYPRVAIPGFRCKGDPLSKNRDLIFWHCIEDKPVEFLNLPKDDKVNWQRFYLPTKLAIHLKSIDAMPAAASTLPKLYAPMTVARDSKGLLASIEIPPRTKGKSQTVKWIEIKNGTLSYGRPE
jgi:hypothetical protein